MRNKVFISHATPTDNDFTRWLALKLIGLGYEVWCDILFLDKGTDFWKSIDEEIRNKTIKFLLVCTNSSLKRDGVLKELAVAEKVKKKLEDPNFIMPLALAPDLSYDDLPPEIIRLNAIDFKDSWAEGLAELLKAFDKQEVEREAPDPTKSNALYNQIFLQNLQPIEEEVIYDSNWFPINKFPEELRFHKYDWRLPKSFDINTLTFPATKYKGYLCTFAWEYDFMHHLPKTETYSNSETIRISTAEILNGNYSTEFLKNSEARKIIVQLVNKAFDKTLTSKKLQLYEMSNKNAYWIEKGTLVKDKYEKVQLVGKQKAKNWHFGISGAAKLYPLNVLMVSSHIFFTEDGKKLIESSSIQHAARRRQGRNWWNDKWRSKLLAFVKLISEEGELILEVGSEEKVHIDVKPLQFKGQKNYSTPDNSKLEEEASIEASVDIEEEIEEIDE